MYEFENRKSATTSIQQQWVGGDQRAWDKSKLLAPAPKRKPKPGFFARLLKKLFNA